MDEPASALDPTATGAIEDLMQTLDSRYTIAIGDPQHAAGRPGQPDRTALLLAPSQNPERATLRYQHVIEYGARRVFEDPLDSRTRPRNRPHG